MKLNRVLYGLLIVAIALIPAGVAAKGVEHELSKEMQKKVDSLPDNVTRIDYLKEQAQAHPKDPAIAFSLGNLLLDEGKTDAAVEQYKKATELDDAFLGAWVNLGNAYDDLDQLDNAQQTYQKALKLDPTDEKTLCNLGGVYFKKRQVNSALDCFEKSLKNHPNSQLTRYNMAILFADSEIYREAKREWEKAVALDPNSDLGKRSAENIKVIDDLMNSETPELPKAEENKASK